MTRPQKLLAAAAFAVAFLHSASCGTPDMPTDGGLHTAFGNSGLAPQGGMVVSVTATTSGGLLAGGTASAPTLGLLTSCGANQVLAYVSSVWTCMSFTPATSISGTLNAVAKFTPDGASLGNSTITDSGGTGAGLVNFTGTGTNNLGLVLIDGASAGTTKQLYIDEGDALHTAAEAINIVTRQRGTFDTTSGVATAEGVDIGCSSSRAAGLNLLTNQCLLVNASGADLNIAIQVNAGTTNVQDINAAATMTALAAFTSIGTTTLADSSHDVSTGRDMTIGRTLFVDPSGTGAGHVESGALGSATRPTGGDIASLEAYSGNGNNALLIFNNALAGQQGWSFYNETDGAHDDLRIFEYNGANADRMTFLAGGNVGIGTVTPGAKLDVNGSARVATTLTVGGDILSPITPTSVSNGSLETGSTDWWGTVTGIGANTSVVLTYSSTFPARSRCVATPNSISVAVEVIVVTARSATSATFSCYSVTTVPVLSNCDDFTYECSGQ